MISCISFRSPPECYSILGLLLRPYLLIKVDLTASASDFWFCVLCCVIRGAANTHWSGSGGSLLSQVLSQHAQRLSQLESEKFAADEEHKAELKVVEEKHQVALSIFADNSCAQE